MDRHRRFEDIFREYYHKLYYHACSFLHDTDASRDVVNDTFEVLWQNFPSYRDTSTIGPYLYSVVRHKCIDILRRHAIHERFVLAADLPGSFREEYDYTDYDARLELIKAQIASLPPQTRNVFILCHIDGFSYQEAAGQLGISVNTVKTHLSRAMKSLREFVTE